MNYYDTLKPVVRLVQVIDHAATGKLAREYRESLNVSLRSVARWMKCSAPFLSDLERGNRNWDEKRLNLFQWAARRAAK